MAYNQNYSQRSNDKVRFDLMEHIGVLGKKDNGWTKEVNIIAWNGGRGKVDIREWDPEHTRMSRGITLFEEEAEALVKTLARRYGLRYTDNMPAKAAAPAETRTAETWNSEAGEPPSDVVPAEAAHAEAAHAEAASAEIQAATMEEQEEEIPFEEAVAEQS